MIADCRRTPPTRGAGSKSSIHSPSTRKPKTDDRISSTRSKYRKVNRITNRSGNRSNQLRNKFDEKKKIFFVAELIRIYSPQWFRFSWLLFALVPKATKSCIESGRCPRARRSAERKMQRSETRREQTLCSACVRRK